MLNSVFSRSGSRSWSRSGSTSTESLADQVITVIGAGFGGLSTAAYLADAGADVTVIEQNDQLGGRASRLHADGFRFDMGPSWYLMPDVFERFFAHFDREPGDYYDLVDLEPHYRVFWKDGDRVEIGSDTEEAMTLFESYEDGAGDALSDYLAQARETYEVGMREFVYRDRSRFRDYLDPSLVRHARGLSLLSTMDEHVAGYFEHPKLRQLVQYSLVFLGGSPSNTPAIYSLMSHVDFGLGVSYPEGGIGSVVDALVSLARERGATFETGRTVTGIGGTPGSFSLDTDQGRRGASVVISDADYAHTEQALLAPRWRRYDESYWDERTYAPSAFCLYLGVEGDVDPFAHHSLVLPTDWDPHFGQIFDEPAWPENPAYYVCVPSLTDDSVAPEGHHAVFLLVPIAAGLEDDEARREQYTEFILADLADATGVDLRDRIAFSRSFSVADFASRYNSRRGTALGLAHTLRQTGPMRPNRRGPADGLYYTGSYTTPGIGMPMCLIAGEHTADAVREDYA